MGGEARIACVPSKRATSGDAEGLPLVCIEAMLSGSALVATKNAGNSECVIDGETGYLVEEGDSEALAARPAKMLSDRETTASMGRASRAFAMQSFNLRKQSVILEDHLLEVGGLA